MKQILILNITRMGDLIQMTPLLARLQEEWSDVAIDLIVDQEFSQVASLLPGIRQIYAYDFQNLMDESRVCARDVVSLYQDLTHWAKPILQVGYDRVVNLTFNRRSAFLVKFFGCADERGMTTTHDGTVLVKDSWMKYFLDFHAYRHVNRFNIVDLYALGGSGPGRFHPIHIPVSSRMSDWARTFLQQSGRPTAWVAVQVGASDPMKAWRPEYFGQFMAHLGQEHDLGFVLIGTRKEEPVVKEAMQVYQQAGGKAVLCDAVGQTSVTELLALLQQCHLMVTNDTGPMHMAVAVQTPVLNVSVGHVDFWETGPFGPGHWVVQPDIVCGPCGFDKVCPHHACKDHIIPQELAELARHLLGRLDFPLLSSKIRVYEGGVNEDQLGSFILRSGSESPLTSWYGTYWRRYWYELYTGQSSLCPRLSCPPPDQSEIHVVWDQLAPILDILCEQTGSMFEFCRQQPMPVQQVKDAQSLVTDNMVALNRLVRLSLAFGPLGAAAIRETYNLEGQTLLNMAEENVAIFQTLRTRAQSVFQQFTRYSPEPSRRNFYAGAIG